MANPFASFLGGAVPTIPAAGGAVNANVRAALVNGMFLLPFTTSRVVDVSSGADATRTGTAGTVDIDSDGFMGTTSAGERWTKSLPATIGTNVNYAMVVRQKFVAARTGNAGYLGAYIGGMMGGGTSYTKSLLLGIGDTAMTVQGIALSGGGGIGMNSAGFAGAIDGIWLTCIFRSTNDNTGNFTHELAFVDDTDTLHGSIITDTSGSWFTSGDPLLNFELTGTGKMMHHYGAVFRPAGADEGVRFGVMPTMTELRAFAASPQTYLQSSGAGAVLAGGATATATGSGTLSGAINITLKYGGVPFQTTGLRWAIYSGNPGTGGVTIIDQGSSLSTDASGNGKIVTSATMPNPCMVLIHSSNGVVAQSPAGKHWFAPVVPG